jgi:hypothetical protein
MTNSADIKWGQCGTSMSDSIQKKNVEILDDK